jgi:hypothetical protein
MPAMQLIQIGIVGAGTMGDRSRSESISTPMDAWNMGRAPWQLGQTCTMVLSNAAGWLSLFSRTGATLREVRELSTDGQFPQSIIFVVESTQRAP